MHSCRGPHSSSSPKKKYSPGTTSTFRRFNRYFTRRIGALDDHYLGQDRPLGEARLLFEIGDGVSLRELRGRLALDAGYLSRMAKSLEAQGLVPIRSNYLRLVGRLVSSVRWRLSLRK